MHINSASFIVLTPEWATGNKRDLSYLFRGFLAQTPAWNRMANKGLVCGMSFCRFIEVIERERRMREQDNPRTSSKYRRTDSQGQIIKRPPLLEVEGIASWSKTLYEQSQALQQNLAIGLQSSCIPAVLGKGSTCNGQRQLLPSSFHTTLCIDKGVFL